MRNRESSGADTYINTISRDKKQRIYNICDSAIAIERPHLGI